MNAVRADGGVRLVMKDWPIFGAVSVRASQLVLAAQGSGHYAAAMDALMATTGRLSDAQVDAKLAERGLDAGRLTAAYRQDAARIDGLLARNNRQAEAFGFNGTPSFVVQTTLFPGVMDEAALREAIAEARG